LPAQSCQTSVFLVGRLNLLLAFTSMVIQFVPCSFSMSISAPSKCLGHHEHCAPFVTAKSHLCKMYRGFLSMQVCAVGYVLMYVPTPKLRLVSWTVIGLTVTKIKPLILPMHGF
jgi:hypothetical protein